MSKTKDKIVEKAIELYNRHGIEYVGVRELAKELDMKGGNITYYFPTKDDLVFELTTLLSKGNAEILAVEKETTVYNFLDMHRKLYQNQYKYRALFVSLPLLLKQNEQFLENYKERQGARKKAIYDDLRSLFLKGYFQTAKAADLDTVLHAIISTNRFWVAEATVDNMIEDKALAISTNLKKLAGLLHIIASDKGKADIERFTKELE